MMRFLSALLVMAVLSPACCVLANSLWPWFSVWLAGFSGGLAEMEACLSSSSARLPPSVCVSVSTPICSHLHDRCQGPTLGLSTLQLHTHRGNYSLGAGLLFLCSTIYHQSVQRHLSSSPLHPDITGPQGLRPTSAAITWASPLAFSLSCLSSHSLSLLLHSPLAPLSTPWLPHYSLAISLH